MGSSASKAARKYPPQAAQAALKNGAKARAPPAPAQTEHLADSHRSAAIERDAGDPDFMANLSRLGQVRVDHHMQPVRLQSPSTTKLFESRAEAVNESSQPTRNKLYAFVLSDLLDKRKAVKTRADLEKLAKEYNVDVDKLEGLARFVSSPSISNSNVRPAKGKSEEEGFIATAVWLEPNLRGS
ncbi:unnamed protein product [Cyclocybe aegerita]|uniref:Uncharacterized protein n=1 Tax=Cyclocybe aegerita TaxID=1973307 RepID=A0A8S0VSR3_CYCAE|nr:unnamed protein product [Cyclocybe aegerita]